MREEKFKVAFFIRRDSLFFELFTLLLIHNNLVRSQCRVSTLPRPASAVLPNHLSCAGADSVLQCALLACHADGFGRVLTELATSLLFESQCELAIRRAQF